MSNVHDEYMGWRTERVTYMFCIDRVTGQFWKRLASIIAVKISGFERERFTNSEILPKLRQSSHAMTV